MNFAVLDKIDIKALALLQTDGRLTNKSLAAAIGLSPSACLQRVRRLEQLGIIRRYMAVLDLGKLCEHITVFAEITLAEQGKNSQANFESLVRALPQAAECHVVSGDYDYHMRFICRNIAEYHALSERLLNDESLGIQQIQSRVCLTPIKEFAGADLKSLID